MFWVEVIADVDKHFPNIIVIKKDNIENTDLLHDNLKMSWNPRFIERFDLKFLYYTKMYLKRS